MVYSINFSGKVFILDTPKVMGIINVTPDSFYENSRKTNIKTILLTVEAMIKEGVHIIDIGAISTRPGSFDIGEAEEKKRLISALKQIRKHFPNLLISVDTFRASLVKIAASEGANIINDVSGGQFDPMMFLTVSETKLAYILMHTPAKPEVMQQHTHYNNVLSDIAKYFDSKIKQLHSLGVKDIIIDPGFGFGKTIDQNYHIMSNLSFFQSLNCPILVGVSRKSMIYKALNITANDALCGTITLNTLSLLKGASIIRVHDVKEAVQTIKIVELLKQNQCLPI